MKIKKAEIVFKSTEANAYNLDIEPYGVFFGLDENEGSPRMFVPMHLVKSIVYDRTTD